LVFDAPRQRNSYPVASLRDPAFYTQSRVPVAKDGTVPFLRYVVRKKGEVEVEGFSCAMCHTRVMADGSIIKGAQGNFSLAAADAFDFRRQLTEADEAQKEELQQFIVRFRRALNAAPWVRPDPLEELSRMSLEEYLALADSAASVTGVMPRTGSSLFYPVQIPDLIGVQERRYLDRTGLVRHRDIGDLMRYAALAQGMDMLAAYGDFRPIEALAGKLPDPESGERYSDEQLYALARYLYSLKPPPNPNKSDAVAARGKKVFDSEGCAGCHTPPLYTNNKLTVAAGFEPPENHAGEYDILQVSVGTDPNLALKTRRGTGYYKVPSLKGVWYRGPFEHSGSVMTLEDWFDPRRLRDDYVPTGFKGIGMRTRPVKGHEFGLRLSAEDKRTLIAFLRTLWRPPPNRGWTRRRRARQTC
jgi:mono/diheme cytochrome c family protein